MIVQLQCFKCGVVMERLEVVQKHRGFPRRKFRILSVCADCVAEAKAEMRFESEQYADKLDRQVVTL